jgi:hypothetical protein
LIAEGERWLRRPLLWGFLLFERSGVELQRRCASFQWTRPGQSMGARAVIAVLLSAMVCSCAFPVKKSTRAKPDHFHHHSVVRVISHHELSETEKDKLFEDFQRWRAAQGQVEPGASSLVEFDQHVDPR